MPLAIELDMIAIGKIHLVGLGGELVLHLHQRNLGLREIPCEKLLGLRWKLTDSYHLLVVGTCNVGTKHHHAGQEKQ